VRLTFSVNCEGKCLKQFWESPCFVYNIEVPVMTWYHVIDYLHLGNRTLDVISVFLNASIYTSEYGWTIPRCMCYEWAA